MRFLITMTAMSIVQKIVSKIKFLFDSFAQKYKSSMIEDSIKWLFS